jgi:hypothetical protein
MEDHAACTAVPPARAFPIPWPVRLRARLWVSPRALRAHDESPRLWLVLADGPVLALRLAHGRPRDDGVLAPLAEAFAADVRGNRYLIEDLPGVGFVQVLYAAPVVPPLAADHAGFVIDGEFQHFVATLDGEVLRLLLSLEREPTPAAITRRDGESPHPWPQPFFASVRNYNRLVTLPPTLRERRMQALIRFPALVAPVLLTAHRNPNTWDGKRHAWREKDEAVEAAIDQGRDLIGSLAAHYGITRGTVRAPVNRAFWNAPAHQARRGYLQMLDALPDNQRPTLAEFERWALYFANYFGLLGENRDGDPLPQPPAVHRGAFRLGWSRTWEAAARRYGNLYPALADCRDFLQAARERARLILRRNRVPGTARLAAAWLATQGLLGLLAASDRWHRLRPTLPTGQFPPDFRLPAILGHVDHDGHTAEELLDPVALAREGEAMHHCVGGYWQRCVDGDRIFALRLADGERATAQYAPRIVEGGVADTRYRLVQLRGPCNRDVSAAMRVFAQAIETRLNAEGLREKRWAALEARGRLEVAQLESRLAQREAMAWLDGKSERQLRVALAWLNEQPPAPEVLLTTFIAGYQYHAGPRVEEALRVGEPLGLAREPENPHDPLAVRLDWQGHKLGYLPHNENAEIARLLDAGEALVASITGIDRAAEPWERVRVGVAMPAGATAQA